MTPPATPGPHDQACDALAARLAAIVGTDRVQTDPDRLRWMCQDIWSDAAPARMAVAPATTAELAACAAAAAAAGAVLVPRGGGLSYTGGYAAGLPDAVLVDTRRMDRVLHIDAENMVVTVQAGCTWAALHDALTPLGLRAPFWGPLSGLGSTIGGGVSQNNAFFGAGLYGTTAESVVGLTLVLADGTLLRTGVGAEPGRPAYRHFGPDLTGLFCGDTGALALKAEVTLRLIPAPAHEAYASFGFPTAEALLAGMSALSRAGIGAEVFGFDPALTRLRMKRASLMADVKTLGKVVGAQSSWREGIKAAAKVALAGRGHLDDAGYNGHVVVEGRSRAAVEDDIAEARRLLTAAGGREVEAAIPRIIRAQPFTPPNNILGPEGERWVPVHGIIAHGRAAACWADLQALYAAHADAVERHGITIGHLATTMSTNGLLIEPVFLWPEQLLEVHERFVEPGMLARLPRHPPAPEATAAVARLRGEVLAVFRRHGAAHFQIGRTYPYRAAVGEEAFALLSAIKRHLDPGGRINPGVLGL